jgi:UDP-glucose 4-epimerase
VKPKRLRILGDGEQRKPYIHASDVVAAAFCATKRTGAPFSVFNVATDDTLTVKEIAEIAVETIGLFKMPVFEYSGGPRGWRGDVPLVRLDSTRVRSLGWFPKWNSREAMRQSLQELIADERALRN